MHYYSSESHMIGETHYAKMTFAAYRKKTISEVATDPYDFQSCPHLSKLVV